MKMNEYDKRLSSEIQATDTLIVAGENNTYSLEMSELTEYLQGELGGNDDDTLDQTIGEINGQVTNLKQSLSKKVIVPLYPDQYISRSRFLNPAQVFQIKSLNNALTIDSNSELFSKLNNDHLYSFELVLNISNNQPDITENDDFFNPYSRNISFKRAFGTGFRIEGVDKTELYLLGTTNGLNAIFEVYKRNGNFYFGAIPNSIGTTLYTNGIALLAYNFMGIEDIIPNNEEE